MKIFLLQMSQYFPKPFRSFGGNINIKVDLSNYATETDLRNVAQVYQLHVLYYKKILLL